MELKKHVEIFAGWFRKQRVDLVIANGDLALNEFDLEAVMEIIGKNFKKIPVLMLPGNSESRTSFNRTVTQMAKKYPNFINGAMVRRLDWNKHTFGPFLVTTTNASLAREAPANTKKITR